LKGTSLNDLILRLLASTPTPTWQCLTDPSDNDGLLARKFDSQLPEEEMEQTYFDKAEMIG
jgi:hypothetical protein